MEAFSKEELIKKVFSVEFTRFYNYYKKAKNLNVNAGDMSEGSKDTVRYFINIGGKDDFDWMSLKDFLKEMLGLDKDELYKVDVKESFSFFNTDSLDSSLSSLSSRNLQSLGRARGFVSHSWRIEWFSSSTLFVLAYPCCLSWKETFL